tara:strand:- start:725 stop:2176 length:1452 start_codon:yes stop_codon:yes gene_type:complete
MALTDTGLLIRRFPEIQKTIQDSMKESISNELVFDEDIILGQVVDIIAQGVSVVEETVEAIYNNLDRDKSEGSTLDSLLYLVGLTRLAAATSKGSIQFTTDEGITIPIGSICENPSSKERFSTIVATLSTVALCDQATIEVSDVVDSSIYTITLDDVDYSYTSPPSATAAGIANGLATAINADPLATATAGLRVEPSGVILNKVDSVISVRVEDKLTPYKAKVSVPSEAIEVGSVKASADTITSLVTAIGGNPIITNGAAFGVGRLREKDSEFRLRASRSLSVSGSATYFAILASILSVSEVTTANIVENSSSSTVGGLPPHSFEVVVSAPISDLVDQEIASTIWREKPIGIQTHGNTTITILDSNSVPRQIKFSRPTDIIVATKVTYTLYDEEIFPATGETLIRDAIINTASLLTSGEDVIPRRFVGPIYSAVDGLDSVVVEMQTLSTVGGTPIIADWSEARIPVSPNEGSVFPTNQIYVSV